MPGATVGGKISEYRFRGEHEGDGVIERNLIVVKPAMGFTLPWGGVTPALIDKDLHSSIKRGSGTSSLFEGLGEEFIMFA